ncbi:MAG: hypothetical protein AAFY98_12280, partial [Verrucomicrobiota bacterium]
LPNMNQTATGTVIHLSDIADRYLDVYQRLFFGGFPAACEDVSSCVEEALVDIEIPICDITQVNNRSGGRLIHIR